ncbi:MAG: glycosyltransferase family 2 protein [Rhodospirillales bacterium]|nr:glycosyltransferase family 2 protein [Acetobacter sp.]
MVPASQPSVAVTIVTYNSEHYIGRCLPYVLAQDLPALKVVVVDNASTDRTRYILEAFRERITVIRNEVNAGFARAQNQAIRAARCDWTLTLNPDVRLTPGFLRTLVAEGEHHPQVGTVCGKLLSFADDFAIPSAPQRFDSTGIYMTPNLRHFDRGSGSIDDRRFSMREYVFGATGAAALYRRTMIDAISWNGEFFDDDFFAYREDADVAWRAQLMGWSCLYTPEAVAFHVRNVLPTNRRSSAPAINMHSVKNRFLLRIKNVTPDLYRRHGLAMTARDLLVIAGCLLYEWRSLKAFKLVLSSLRRTLQKRRDLMSRRTASDSYIAQWFASEPASFPAQSSVIQSTTSSMGDRTGTA